MIFPEYSEKSEDFDKHWETGRLHLWEIGRVGISEISYTRSLYIPSGFGLIRLFG
jgi:hypothetical protein